MEFGGLAQRPMVAFARAGAEVDVVVADQVDVLVVGVVDPGDRAVGQLDPESFEVREAERDVAGVPVMDRVGTEPAGFELAMELLRIARADTAAVAVAERASQCVGVLAFVELGVGALAERRVAGPTQNEVGLDQPAVFAQRSGGAVGLGVGRHPGDQHAGDDPAAFDRPGDPQQLVPLLEDQLGADAVGEQLLGGDERVGLAEQVQPPFGEVGQARVELPAEQVRDGEGQLGGAVRVGGVLDGRGCRGA